MVTRRQLLKNTAVGFGSVALAGLMGQGTANAEEPNLLQRQPHFPAKAKRIIFLFMHGGPSQIDTFDYKPQLAKDDNKPVPFDKPRVVSAPTGNLLKSPFKFKQHGESSMWVSEIFPHIAKHVDELTFVKSVHGSNSGTELLCLNFTQVAIRLFVRVWVAGSDMDSEMKPESSLLRYHLSFSDPWRRE